MLYNSGGNYILSESAYIKKGSSEGTTPMHTHGFIEICYTYRGKCTHIIDDKEINASHGDAVIVNHGQKHTLICSKGSQYVNLLLKPEMINDSIRGSENAFSLLSLSDFKEFSKSVNRARCFISFDKSEQIKIESLINLMIDEQNLKSAGNMLIQKSGFNILLTYIFRKMSLPMSESFSGINENTLIFIKENCHRKLTSKEIAKHCGYNPSYFSKAFSAYCLKTFTQYLTECRIERACHLLENTDKSVEQIIFESGFSDRTRFFTLFEKYTGYTPLKYRKK